MIVYSATKARFRQDVMTNDIGTIIFDTFRSVTGHSTNRSEINDTPAIPADAGVAIEYHLPRSSKRLPFLRNNGKIKPSKNLADSLASMLQGNQEFVMVDDQKIVYETALAQARQAATFWTFATPETDLLN